MTDEIVPTPTALPPVAETPCKFFPKQGVRFQLDDGNMSFHQDGKPNLVMKEGRQAPSLPQMFWLLENGANTGRVWKPAARSRKGAQQQFTDQHHHLLPGQPSLAQRAQLAAGRNANFKLRLLPPQGAIHWEIVLRADRQSGARVLSSAQFWART
jgi:hypothetical protein